MPRPAPQPSPRRKGSRPDQCAGAGISVPWAKSRRDKTRCKAAKASNSREGVRFLRPASRESTLARLETALDLVDHIDPALAADQAVVAIATAQRFQRVTDFHETILMRRKAVLALSFGGPKRWRNGLYP